MDEGFGGSRFLQSSAAPLCRGREADRARPGGVQSGRHLNVRGGVGTGHRALMFQSLAKALPAASCAAASGRIGSGLRARIGHPLTCSVLRKLQPKLRSPQPLLVADLGSSGCRGRRCLLLAAACRGLTDTDFVGSGFSRHPFTVDAFRVVRFALAEVHNTGLSLPARYHQSVIGTQILLCLIGGLEGFCLPGNGG